MVEDDVSTSTIGSLSKINLAFGSWSLAAVRWLLRDKNFMSGIGRQKRLSEVSGDLSEADIERLIKALDQSG